MVHREGCEVTGEGGGGQSIAKQDYINVGVHTKRSNTMGL